MREHMGLFRGKRIDTGDWVEGFYHRVTNNWTHENVHYITCFQDMPLTGETILTVQYEVDPDTIGECTGLKDKNGKLIFEGDIVQKSWRGKVYSTGVVKYGEFNCSCCNGVYGWTFDGGDIREPELYEIIGNAIDNPELLKGGEGA